MIPESIAVVQANVSMLCPSCIHWSNEDISLLGPGTVVARS